MQPKLDAKIFKRNTKSLALHPVLRYHQAIKTQEVFPYGFLR